ncbi:hypothetical protein [Streptomyces sp. NRRL S-378]|uniref:hypothetical protein n=1 Tax=Streptomyces sp. NRRL S-378 TaxID=1463904 RepID=UPI000A9E9DB5|nr:hypothetical protein [Streptomyces sp. NRRL S-378]
MDEEPKVSDQRPYEEGQQRRALRSHIEAALARRLGVMDKPSVWPAPAGPSPYDG